LHISVMKLVYVCRYAIVECHLIGANKYVSMSLVSLHSATRLVNELSDHVTSALKDDVPLDLSDMLTECAFSPSITTLSMHACCVHSPSVIHYPEDKNEPSG